MIDDEKGYQYDRSEMLMRQRNMAEEERDNWKIRAMKAEQFRQALRAVCESLRAECEALHATNTNLRDQLVIAEGQRDQAKADAEHWKAEWALVMGQLGGARAEVEALRKVDDAMAVQPTTGEGDE